MNIVNLFILQQQLGRLFMAVMLSVFSLIVDITLA